jgi:hypothetical protein
VSFESRYGTNLASLSVSALMTLPSADNDLLICFASSSRLSPAPVLDTISDPAWRNPTRISHSHARGKVGTVGRLAQMGALVSW